MTAKHDPTTDEATEAAAPPNLEFAFTVNGSTYEIDLAGLTIAEAKYLEYASGSSYEAILGNLRHGIAFAAVVPLVVLAVDRIDDDVDRVALTEELEELPAFNGITVEYVGGRAPVGPTKPSAAPKGKRASSGSSTQD